MKRPPAMRQYARIRPQGSTIDSCFFLIVDGLAEPCFLFFLTARPLISDCLVNSCRAVSNQRLISCLFEDFSPLVWCLMTVSLLEVDLWPRLCSNHMVAHMPPHNRVTPLAWKEAVFTNFFSFQLLSTGVLMTNHLLVEHLS